VKIYLKNEEVSGKHQLVLDSGEESETNDADFSYKEISELSDATEDVQNESIADSEAGDLDDY
jgi:hypothetical protein